MISRLALLVCLVCPASLLADDTPRPPTPAEAAWQRGQLAMDRDRLEEAIGHYELSLRLDPAFAPAHLSLAAAHIALARDKEALPHLAAYLQARPDHFLIRPHYAELLARLGLAAEASYQLERFVADVQPFPRLAEAHLVGSHTKLMEIARGRRDGYNEHLHRGIGLYLLAGKRAELGDEQSLRIAEQLLCKAAAELTLARLAAPTRVRPCWYLHRVWSRLSQQQPATRWLRAAEDGGPMSDLTPVETGDLDRAAQRARLEGQKR
jgi:tetratricopeptide (TPR) repeat protein